MTPALTQQCCAKQCHSTPSVANLAASGPQSSLQAPMMGKEAGSRPASSSVTVECRCTCSPQSVSSPLPSGDHVATPLQPGCGSAACSDAGSASSSRSSSQGDSDVESNGRRPSCSADCSDDDERRSSSSKSQVPGAVAAPKALRPAIRLPRSPVQAQSVSPKSAGEQRKKTVTFNTGGAVICSPPTAEALDLLATGTPPLPVASQRACSSAAFDPTSSSSSSCSSAAPSPVSSTAQHAPAKARAPPPRTAPTPMPSSSAAAPAAAALAHRQPAATAHSSSSRPAADRFPMTSLSMDAAHASALARAAEGRRRVMAALEEAKSRHAHLGRDSHLQADARGQGHPATTTTTSIALLNQGAGGRQQQQQQQQQQHQQQQQQRLVGGVEERQMGRLPNLPLARRDLGILSVGYASPSGDAAAAPPSSVARQLAAPAAAAPSGVEASVPSLRLGGMGDLCGAGAAALGQLAAGDRLRLAEAMAKQSSLPLLRLEGVKKA